MRKAYYADFQQALAADPAYAFICYIDANYVAKSNVKGIDTDTVLGPPRRRHLLEHSGLGNRLTKSETNKKNGRGWQQPLCPYREEDGLWRHY